MGHCSAGQTSPLHSTGSAEVLLLLLMTGGLPVARVVEVCRTLMVALSKA
jgi:hypothetical protein